uniref:Uncharacterized protein n=1 Tax=Panagrolaimus sp. JU765 TaxID=591449 RepID=A0AC34PZI1_9BILA
MKKQNKMFFEKLPRNSPMKLVKQRRNNGVNCVNMKQFIFVVGIQIIVQELVKKAIGTLTNLLVQEKK